VLVETGESTQDVGSYLIRYRFAFLKAWEHRWFYINWKKRFYQKKPDEFVKSWVAEGIRLGFLRQQEYMHFG
ncbi:MAG: hypothetical protein IPM04_08940, partial [Saprospiraceae bacterium]